MIPIHLDPARLRLGVAGRGPLLARRIAGLLAGGARPRLWCDAPDPDLEELAGPLLTARLPRTDEIAPLHVLWVAGLPDDVAAPLARTARAAGVLVNVEDVLPLCDFHTPSVVRRGRLTLSAGTGGASPAAARLVRQKLERAFPEAWGETLDAIAAERDALRRQAAGTAALLAAAEARLRAAGLD